MEWHQCVAWGKLAETAGKYVKKGQQLIVTGHIAYQTWEKDGQKHTSTQVVVDKLEFVGGKQQVEEEAEADFPF